MRLDTEGMMWDEPPRVTSRTRSDAPKALPPIPESNWTLPEGEELFPSLVGQGAIAVDCETKDLDLKERGPGFQRGDAEVVGVAIGTEAGFRQYYPVGHELGVNLPKRVVFGWLRDELSRPDQVKIGANILYDMEALASEGVYLAGPIFDVQDAEALLDETRLSYALEAISRIRLHEGKIQSAMLDWLKAAFGNDETNIKKFIYRAPSQIVGPYAESDVDLPLRIFELQRKQLESEGLWDLFLMESKLSPMLLAMRQRGVPIDLKHTERMYDRLGVSYDETMVDLNRDAGMKVEIWAADNLAKVFDKQGITYPRTAKTKKPSIRKEWLANHAAPIARKIQNARHLDKFRGTFVKGYLLEGHIHGRLHGRFHKLRSDAGGTVSGRFSSSDPNLQNIPVRTADGSAMRQAFISDTGEWWKLDWSQIEYRLIAHYASVTGQPGIQPIIDAYNNDPSTDFHQAVANLVGMARGPAKNLNFGLAYGQGIDLLCAILGVSREEGERIMATYHERAPFIRPLSALCGRRAQENGYIRTMLGRRRRFNVWERRGELLPEINRGLFANILDLGKLQKYDERWVNEDDEEHRRSPENPKYLNLLKNNGWRRAFLHKALNALMQGSAADIMKKAMVQCWEAGVFDAKVLGAPYLTVHDELDGPIERGNKIQEDALRHVRHIMENVVKLDVPIMADLKRGLNWGVLEVAD